ncbi:FHA domain-containing protein [Photobacterium rosenbergii]|uniref:FHA domain-containing protein n=1 Tax=Photobacterium rosenbergii TaxID=294936 RepID=A0A2T3NKT6_9GAMM|nr:FHA domain-containing protein [Photobacterium rosenbergii]PSW16135.1 FHA domain-containing protein [Photobacterium rosenbergii]
MTISFQLIETPENEQVTSRQVALPASGGTIGRSYECTVQLPDFNRTLSRVHAELRPHAAGGFEIIDRSTNGLFINGVQLGKGANQRISDGDKIKLGGYTLLVSDIDALFDENAATNSANQQSRTPYTSNSFPEGQHPFSADSLASDDFQQFVMNQPAATAEAHTINPKQTKQAQSSEFSSENILDDVFGCDPFDDEDWQEQGKPEHIDDVVMLDDDSDPILSGSKAITIAEHHHTAELQNSIDRLNAIIAQQERTLSASIDREKLVVTIEATLERFLESFHPAHLEDEFDDYITGWGNKEKKYWALYKKQFNRKHARREYYRLFSSILLEELSEKR